MKKTALVPVCAIAFTLALIALTFVSESDWQAKSFDESLRRTVGLPSIAIGTNYEGTRNPMIEVFVRSLYDIPGGYDYVVPSSFIDTPIWQDYYRETIPEFNMTMVKG